MLIKLIKESPSQVLFFVENNMALPEMALEKMTLPEMPLPNVDRLSLNGFW